MGTRWLTVAVIFLSTLVATEVVAQGAATQDAGPTAEAQVGTAVVDRALQGAAESFPASVGTVYGYSKIAKTQAGATIEHVWYHNDVEVGRKQLNIGGSPWRTWSSKVIPADATGDWKVEVVADGKVLTSVAFKVQ
ncbi:MAG: DUF2914 domain-containing protein [Gemmatimonadetes bacterium]|nr:DUF2914 domain-containing protein [Gemmatimonadota bacterium]